MRRRRLSSFSSVTAAARRLDGNHVSLLHLPADLRRQLLAVKEVAADPAWFSSFQAVWTVAPAVGEEGEARWFEDFYGADYTVAAAVLAFPARAVEEFVALDAHRVFHLEGFDRGVEGVAHPDVDA